MTTTAIKYGVFINTIVDFVIVAFAIFLVIKQMNRLKKAPPAADPTRRNVRNAVRSFRSRRAVVPTARPNWSGPEAASGLPPVRIVHVPRRHAPRDRFAYAVEGVQVLLSRQSLKIRDVPAGASDRFLTEGPFPEEVWRR